MSEIWIQPTGGALAADVHGVDLSKPLSDAAFARIAEAWAEHLVLRFSGQKLDDPHADASSAPASANSIAFPSPRPTSTAPTPALDKEAEQWVAVISSVVKDGKPVGGLGSYELVWHTDMSYNPLPPRASLLYALEVPPDGGNTGFLNMYAAYETLPADLKRAVEGRTCIHDSSRNSAGELRKGFQRTLDVRRTPGAVHPLVRLHPVTGRKALFLGRRPGAYIHGLSVEDSEALLDAIWAHATQERFAWYQKWRAGDLVMWDNRCVMHRRDAFDESLRRLMHRTQIVGEPVLAGLTSPVSGRLQLEQLGVEAGLRDQLLMGAGCLDRAVGQHEDAVGHAHAGKAVRDQHGGLALAQLLEALEHLELGARVEGGGRLVEDQHLGLAHIGAGDGDLLPFAARQLDTVLEALADASGRSRPAAGRSPRRPGCVLAARSMRARSSRAVDAADGDIVAGAEVVAHEILEDDADAAAQFVEVVVAQIVAVEQDAAFVGS